MNIKKATKILSEAKKGTWPTPNSDLGVAMKLGEEGLKRIQRQRADLLPNEIKLLPGETDE